jgi:hypothetical protein
MVIESSDLPQEQRDHQDVGPSWVSYPPFYCIALDDSDLIVSSIPSLDI